MIDWQIALHPADAQLAVNRAFLYIRLSQFKDAAGDFGRAVAIDPSNFYDWYYLAITKLQSDDEPGYRQAAEQMTQKFGRIDSAPAAGHVALVCLLASPPVGDVDGLSRMADLAIAGESGRITARWFYIAKGLAEYRAGKYAAAQQSLSRARGVAGLFAPITIELLNAMALDRTGANAASARDAYRQAAQRMNNDITRVDVLPNTISLSDYVVCQIVRREADALFAVKPASRPAGRVSAAPKGS